MSKVSGLGYLGATITDPGSWHRLLSTVYGLERRDDSPQGVHQYRLDEQHHRIALYEGDTDNVAHVGWEVETRENLRSLAAHLSENGIAVEPGEVAICNFGLAPFVPPEPGSMQHMLRRADVGIRPKRVPARPRSY